MRHQGTFELSHTWEFSLHMGELLILPDKLPIMIVYYIFGVNYAVFKTYTKMSCHLGANKNNHKILNHFCLQGLKADVSKHCKSCNTCQMVGELNKTIPKVH